MSNPEIEPFVCKRTDRGCSSINLEDRTLKTEEAIGHFTLYCLDCGSYQNHGAQRKADFYVLKATESNV